MHPLADVAPPETAPLTKTELAKLLRHLADELYRGLSYSTEGQLHQLANRIERDGMAREACGGELCQGCPACAIPLAQLTADALPMSTVAHIDAARTKRTIVLNAVVDAGFWRYSECNALMPSLDKLITAMAESQAGTEYRQDLETPQS